MEALADEVGGTIGKLEKTATDEHAALRREIEGVRGELALLPISGK